METGWVRMRGRRRRRAARSPTARPRLPSHFGLEAVGDLPGIDELKGAGLLDGRLPATSRPAAADDRRLREDEDPLEPGDLDLGLAPRGRRRRARRHPGSRDAAIGDHNHRRCEKREGSGYDRARSLAGDDDVVNAGEPLRTIRGDVLSAQTSAFRRTRKTA